MKTISDLKRGDKIYDVSWRQLNSYTYFCVHPHNDNYHILINNCEEPIRMYKARLEAILSLGFETYDQARLGLASRLEDAAKDIRGN